MHILTSRSLRRSAPSSPEIGQIKSSFSKLSHARRSQRRHSQAQTLLHHLTSPSSVSSEEELKIALGGALGSLDTLGRRYLDLEARWRLETMRIADERAEIERMMKQVFGSAVGAGGMGASGLGVSGMSVVDGSEGGGGEGNGGGQSGNGYSVTV